MGHRVQPKTLDTIDSLQRQIAGEPDKVWYHGYHVSWTQQKGTGGPTMSQPTQPKDMGQEAIIPGLYAKTKYSSYA
jgi:hypothetical protein